MQAHPVHQAEPFDGPFDVEAIRANIRNLTRERMIRENERTARQWGWGDTKGGLKIIERYQYDIRDKILRFQETHKRSIKDPIVEINKIDADVLAIVGLKELIDSVSSSDSKSMTMSNIGMAIERLSLEQDVKTFNKSKYDDIVRVVRSRATRKAKDYAFRKLAAEYFPMPEPWGFDKTVRVGAYIYDITISCPIFCEEKSYDYSCQHNVVKPGMTRDALELSDEFIRYLMEQHPIYLPMCDKPNDWTKAKQAVHGYHRDIVRGFHKIIKDRVSCAIKTGQMKPVVDALNRAQSVPWVIDRDMLDIVKWAYEANLAIGSLPPTKDIPSIERFDPYPWACMSDDERKPHKIKAAKVHERNRGFIGERLMYQRQMATADYIGTNVFYVPMDMDYRGRFYGIPTFNFQGPDYIRSLFRFRDGCVVHNDPDALYWLKVHVANCGDFDKVSKASFDDRVAWVDNHPIGIRKIVENPKEVTWWTQADKPFQFLSACRELVSAIDNPNHICRLPISFDGSCSGLQHLAAMTRDETVAKLVNLTSSDKPQDVYGAVGNMVKDIVDADAANGSLVATKWQAYGVGRSTVKRNVMTFCYSSKPYGMAKQQRTDLMEPLAYDVLSGKLETHPLALEREDGTLDNGFQASVYIAKKAYASIRSIACKPAAAMDFLVGIARACAHEGKYAQWTTPLGFPVTLVKNESSFKQKSILLGKDVFHFRNPEETYSPSGHPKVHKKQSADAIASCFVHSLDACHLQMVVNEAWGLGIHQLALVHDSFGCLPSDATKLREVLNKTFVILYESSDVLADIRNETLGRIDDKSRVPEVPTFGNLDMHEVHNARFAFS